MKIRIKREHHRVYLEGSRNCAVHTKWQKIQSGSGYAAIRNKKSSTLYMYVCTPVVHNKIKTTLLCICTPVHVVHNKKKQPYNSTSTTKNLFIFIFDL